MITIVVSVATRTVVSATDALVETAFGSIFCVELELGDAASVEGVDEAAVAPTEVESDRADVPGLGLTGGKSSCEIAITTSERNRARKKRLSIQGTGS